MGTDGVIKAEETFAVYTASMLPSQNEYSSKSLLGKHCIKNSNMLRQLTRRRHLT